MGIQYVVCRRREASTLLEIFISKTTYSFATVRALEKGCSEGTGTIVGQNAIAVGNLDRKSIYAGSADRKICSNII